MSTEDELEIVRNLNKLRDKTKAEYNLKKRRKRKKHRRQNSANG